MERQVMKPFRAPRQVIKETQEEAEMDNIGRDIVGQKEKQQQDEGVDCHGERWTIVARKERFESLDGGVVSHEPS
jgi:hypothetical protein